MVIDQDALNAAINLVQRSGAQSLEFGYLNDDVPVGEAAWWAHAQYRGTRLTVEHHGGPVEAVEALARRLNRDAILELEREAITSLIVQTDITGSGGSLTRIDGDHVIAFNGRREAICLQWNGRSDSTITRDVLVQMFDEAKRLRLNKPLRVYGSTCVVGETDSFRFCQIPDEIVSALSLSDDAENADAETVVAAVETLETASQGNLPARARH